MTDRKEKSTLLLEVVTPEKIFYKDEVHLVNIPGLQGELGILRGHMSLVVELKNGLVAVFDSAMALRENFIVSGGFAEINHKSVSILAEEAGFLKDFEVKQVSESLVKFNEDLEFCSSEVEKNLLIKKISYYQTILELLQN